MGRISRWAGWITVALTGSSVIWITLRVGGAWATMAFADVEAVALAALAALSCILAGRRARRPRERLGWLLLGSGVGSWSLGAAVWTWFEIGRDAATPFPSVADVGFVLMIPLAVTGVVALAPIRPTSILRHVLDGCILAAGLLFLSWVLVLSEIHASHRTSEFLTHLLALAYPLGDVVILGVVLLSVSRAAGSARLPFVLVGAGMAAVAVGDSAFAYLAEDAGFTSGDPIHLMWIIGFAVVALGGWRRVVAGEAAPAGEVTRRVHAFGALPLITVVVSGGVAMAVQITRGTLEPFLIWNGLAIVLLLVARNTMSMLEVGWLNRDLERKVSERTAELRAREERFRALVANSSDVVTVVDPDLRVAYVSESLESVLGHGADSAVGREVTHGVHPQDRHRLAALCRDLLERPGAGAVLQYRVRRADGSWRHVESTVKNLVGDPAVGGLVLNTRDVTERRVLEEELSHQAFHDALTELPNRALFIDRLEQAFARSARRAAPVTMLYLDLDGFKAVNDTYGHAFGDRVLQAVAERLQSIVRSSDTVARFGGDEFGVLLDDGAGPDQARTLATRIIEAFGVPLLLADQEVVVTACIGMAATSTGIEDADDLLRNADVAMYRAKTAGRGAYEEYDPELHATLRDRLELEADLRRALDRGELFVEYQPIVALDTERVTGVEALVRWRHPVRGTLPPSEFIGLAEESGLIGPIGSWVLVEACRQLREWRDQIGSRAPSTLSVNVSPRQLRDRDLVDRVADALAAAGIEPEALVLEITESLLVEDPEGATAQLQAIKDLGVTIAIDDFGTGYSSLSYLRRFPIDVLKIDRVFVQALGGGAEDAALAHAIVKLGRTFRMRTVAEGVETLEQAEALRRMGCDSGQGFLFSPPVPAADLERKLRAPLRLGSRAELSA